MNLTALLAERRDAARQPSLSAAVAIGGELVWSDAVGEADPLVPGRTPTAATQYRIASLTKAQVAVAVLALVDTGDVTLHEPLARWVPDAPFRDASVAHFLAHTSGLPAEPAGAWWERAGGPSWSALVAQNLPRLAPPGARFHYSNVGFGVLGRLLETVHGRPWDAVLADVVWTPLGMTRTGRLPLDDHAVGVAVHPTADLIHAEPVPDYRALGAAGELWSTPADLVRFGCFLAGVGEGRGVLRPETLRLMRSPFAVADLDGEPWASGYGLGLMLANTAGRRTPGHTGSVPGFTSDLRFDPDAALAVAVCGNSTSPFGGALPLLDAALATLPTPSGTPAEPNPDADAAGGWFWGSRASELTVQADGRLALRGTAGDVTVFVRDAHGWVGTGGDYFHGERLTVLRDASGTPIALDVGTFCFTRTPYDPAVEPPGGRDPRGWHRP